MSVRCCFVIDNLCCVCLLWVFCGCVLGVCGVWVGCVVFFVVAEAARPVTGKAVIWLWVVLVVGVEILSLFLFAGFGACLRLAGCGVRVSACCTCWCAGCGVLGGVCACVV